MGLRDGGPVDLAPGAEVTLATGAEVDLASGAQVLALDPLVQIAAGEVSGHSIVFMMGERESMLSGAASPDGEDIWRGNELSPAADKHVPYPGDAGVLMSVTSESSNDTDGGSGIGKVKVHYITPAGAEASVLVTLNGGTVDIPATLIRFVNDFHAEDVPASSVADDHIKIHLTGDTGTVYDMIAEGGNQSLNPNYMVPSGSKLILVAWHATEAQGKRVNVRPRATAKHGHLEPGIFCFKGTCMLNKTTTGELTLAEAIPALGIVKITGWPDASGAEVACGWTGILMPE